MQESEPLSTPCRSGWNWLGVLPWSGPEDPGLPDGHCLCAQPLKEQPVWENGRVRTEPEKGQRLTGQLSLLQDLNSLSPFCTDLGKLSVAGKKSQCCSWVSTALLLVNCYTKAFSQYLDCPLFLPCLTFLLYYPTTIVCMSHCKT